MPNPYDFKETVFIDIPYLRIPGEYEGYGIPLILENPQIMLNMIKNQRLDAVTLSIHKQWIVNPLANVNKEDLVARPMGIIYTPDPNGVREVVMSDIKPSAYREEESIKSDMRYGCGVDDFSMAVGGSAGSATEVRHLRESTLERVRLFVNHLGEAYSKVMRYWISMYRQFFTEEMVIRITGEDGNPVFPIIEGDDLKGEYDYKATVLPSLSGQNDVKKKQDMDLFQLLISLPFLDPKAVTSKLLYDFNWSLSSLEKKEEETPLMPGMEGGEEGMAGQEGMMGPEGMAGPMAGAMPKGAAAEALALLSGGKYAGASPGASPMRELSSPVNLLNKTTAPPTPKGIPTTNPRGMNRTGAVNTNIPLKQNNTPEALLMNRARNIQS